MLVGWKATVAAPACPAGTLRARRFSPRTHQVIPPAIAAAPTADQAATAAALSCWVSFLIPAATPTAMIGADFPRPDRGHDRKRRTRRIARLLDALRSLASHYRLPQQVVHHSLRIAPYFERPSHRTEYSLPMPRPKRLTPLHGRHEH